VRLADGATNPVWSPDSRRVAYSAYVRSSAGAQRDVFTVAANGLGRVRVTHTAGSNEQPIDWQRLAPR
jgi:Tol biopolymer transport system component